MQLTDFNLKLFGTKTAIIGTVLGVSNIFLFLIIFILRGKGGGLLGAISFLSVAGLSILLGKALYKCTHQHEEFDTLTKKLVTAQLHLDKVEAHKVELIQSLPDKYRTPVQVIRGYASMIIDGTLGSIAAEPKEYMSRILRASEDMSAIIEHLITQHGISNDAEHILNKTEGVGQGFSKNYSEKIKTVVLWILIVVAFLSLMYQVFLAPSVLYILGETIVAIVAVFTSLFLVNEMKHEPESDTTMVNLAADFDLVSKRLAFIEKEKFEFLSSLSTGLRTPLNGIMNDAHSLTQEPFNELSLETKEAIDKIIESGERLITTITETVESLTTKDPVNQ